MTDSTYETDWDRDVVQTIPHALRRTVLRFPDHDAVVDGPLRLTYTDLQHAVDEVAAAFIGWGLQPGDRVAIWGPNTARWVVLALGVLTAGGVVIPLNTRYKGNEAAYATAASGARVAFVANGFLGNDYAEMLRSTDLPLPALEAVFAMSDIATTASRGWDEFLAYGTDFMGAAVDERLAQIDSTSPSDIMFTSGTTGRPKGVVITHGMNFRQYNDYSYLLKVTDADRYLVVAPFFHSFGYKGGIFTALIRGAAIIPQAVFNVDEMLELIDRESVTVLPGPPAFYQAMLEHPGRDQFDLSSLRLAVTGAAVVPVELLRRMRKELSFKMVLTAYGLTEVSGVATMCRHGDPEEVVSFSAGRAIPGYEIRIVDELDHDVPQGEPGEVLIRGYGVMLGYHNDPEATASTITPDGWLRSGDIGRLDADGNLTITDRKKEMFIVGGFNTYPAEIENAILELEQVSQVAVVGVSDERLGEVGVAFVVPRLGEVVDDETIKTWCGDRLANFKVPRAVYVCDSLPTNASGKVQKSELAKLAESRKG